MKIAAELAPDPADHAGADSSGLRRTLQARHMRMIALGGVIGAGLFLSLIHI